MRPRTVITQAQLEEIIDTFKAVRDNINAPHFTKVIDSTEAFKRGWVYAFDGVLAYLDQFDQRESD